MQDAVRSELLDELKSAMEPVLRILQSDVNETVPDTTVTAPKDDTVALPVSTITSTDNLSCYIQQTGDITVTSGTTISCVNGSLIFPTPPVVNSATPLAHRVHSDQGYGYMTFAEDHSTNATIASVLGMSTQTALTHMSESLSVLSRAGRIGTFYITVTGDMANVVLKTQSGVESHGAFWPSNKTALINDVQRQIKSNLTIYTKNRNRDNLSVKISPQEQRARDTLRDMLTEQDWRRYVTNGFIMVKGASGNWYQLWSKHTANRVAVYRDGKKTHSICIHTDDSCPPTDHVINLKILIEIDESELWKNGNVHNTTSQLGNGSFDKYLIKTEQKCGNLVDYYSKSKQRYSVKEISIPSSSGNSITIWTTEDLSKTAVAV